MKNIMLGLALALVAIICFSLGQVSQSNARVIIREKVKTYVVTGDTGFEIYKSMVKKGPKHDASIKDVLASTSFKLDFKNITFESSKNRCNLTNIDIVINVTYTYPKWVVSKRASKETRAAWRKFRKVAIWHEKEHVKITKNFAKSYERTVKKSRRRATAKCENETLHEKLLVSLAIRKHERLHRSFDRRDLRRGGRGYKALIELVEAK